MRKISKSEAFKLLNKTKIFVGCPTISKRVQNQLFNVGFNWRGYKNEHKYVEEPFIFCEDGELTYESIDGEDGEDIDYFIEHRNKEISAMEILDWKIVDDLAIKLKTKDDVLVRNSDDDEWTYSIYSHFSDGIFKVINGMTFTQCIPYEGNEYLLGTTNKPKPNN